MSTKNFHSVDDKHRVVSFPRRGSSRPESGPVKDLTEFESDRREDSNDYHHRMVVNALVFLFVAGLIALGLWLANTMADMRKGQDCVLSGRRGCTPIEFNGSR
jgi:hypothetical protein